MLQKLVSSTCFDGEVPYPGEVKRSKIAWELDGVALTGILSQKPEARKTMKLSRCLPVGLSP